MVDIAGNLRLRVAINTGTMAVSDEPTARYTVERDWGITGRIQNYTGRAPAAQNGIRSGVTAAAKPSW